VSERLAVRVDAQGRPVAEKRATGARAARRLAHEAAMLAAARHPGVVELLAAEVHDDRAVLDLALVQGRPLAEHPFRSPGDLAATRVGKSYRIEEDEVHRYLSSRYTEAG